MALTTMAASLDAAPAFPDLVVALMPVHDEAGRLVGVRTQASDLTPEVLTSAWVINAGKQEGEEHFSRAIRIEVERRWLEIEIGLRMSEQGREVGRYSTDEIETAQRKAMDDCDYFYERHLQRRDSRVLMHVIRKELDARGGKELSAHARMNLHRGATKLEADLDEEKRVAAEWWDRSPQERSAASYRFNHITDQTTVQVYTHRAVQAMNQEKQVGQAAHASRLLAWQAGRPSGQARLAA